jgi:DNA-binding CsgD family transcriptional regulator
VPSEDRLEFVAEMTLLGFSPGKIADRLGVSEGTIKKDLETVRIRWQKNRTKSYSQFIEEELAFQQMLLSSLQQGIAEGSWKHVETALKISERRANVVGLNHTDRMDQARVEIEKAQLDMIGNALAKVLDVLGLSDDQRELATTTLLLALEAPAVELEEDDII